MQVADCVESMFLIWTEQQHRIYIVHIVSLNLHGPTVSAKQHHKTWPNGFILVVGTSDK